MQSRRISFVLALALSALLGSLPVSAAEPYLDGNLEEEQRIFRTNYRVDLLREGHTGRGIRSVLSAGGHWGSNGHWHFADHDIPDPDILYWRYWLRFDSDFSVSAPDRGKLPGPAGLYSGQQCYGGRPSTEDKPCWSARMLFSRAYGPGGDIGPDDKTLLGFYLYHLDSPANRGDNLVWDPAVALLDHGEWYCVEGMVAMNIPGQHDGVLRGWVDGDLAFERTDIAFRRQDETDIKTKTFWFNPYYGGQGTSPRDNTIDFDSIALGPDRLGCDDTLAWDGYFADDDGNTFESDADWLYLAGLTNGCGGVQYCPEEPVTRGQMAAFIRRAFGLPSSSVDSFTDDDGSVFEGDIQALASAGITRGCNPPDNDRFCPNDPVTRGQMAAFLHRAYGSSLETTGQPTAFIDTAGSVFASDIAWLSSTGVTRGCNPPTNDRYCPGRDVTRGQMAAFIRRAES